MYHIIRLFTHFTKFVPEIVLLWLKNRNQRVHTGRLMRGGDLYEGGAYTWNNTIVKKKVGLSARGPIRGRSV